MLLPLCAITAFLACVPGGFGAGLESPISPNTPMSSLIASAKAHLSSGSPRDALLYLDAAISRDPTNYLTVFQRGAAYLSLGRRAQAQDDFDRVLQLKPNFEGALLQRARLRVNTADWSGALNDLEKAGKKNTPEYEEFQNARDATIRALDAEKKGAWEACVSEATTAIAKANFPRLNRPALADLIYALLHSRRCRTRTLTDTQMLTFRSGFETVQQALPAREAAG